ncbi:hypothetical protein NLU13_5101 [Sarocladium strictum]|uniref:Uncharacterized protein n=1 Tax=Sarocladium strictum TaxID=5046 RepID=A0AA39GLJ9_SARSR|nr:hypothetical protein NLU13_5101 [Sarocladium strictum]
MPTASTAGVLSLNNVGNLTTTFTAPSSCTTAPGFIASGIGNPQLEGHLVYTVGLCGDEPDFPKDCLPNGEEVSKIWESLDTAEFATVLNYYSPGLHCPDAWATVGVYAPGHHSNDSTTTATAELGIFSPTAFNNGRPGDSTSFPYADFIANMFTSALASTETAVVCCPSGFSVDPYAGCFSNFPVTSLADKTGCIRSATGGEAISQERTTYTYEFWGDTTTATQNNIELPTETEFYSTVTITFDGSGFPDVTDGLLGPRPTGDDATELQGVAIVTPLFLVQDGRDNDGGDDEDREDEENQDEDNDDGSSDDNNVAGRLSPVAGVLAAWGLSVAAGFGVLVAW